MLTDKELPLISCLLVTDHDRLDLFKRSIRCFNDQTYPNRELVIVNEGPSEYQAQLLEAVSKYPDIKVRPVFLDGIYTLGGLRNISMALCNGDYWVQWDDDDFNLPERLSTQFSFFQTYPEAKICYMSDQLHFYFNCKELYWNNWGRYHSAKQKRWSLIPGTGMARRDRINVRYPSAGGFANAGEDSVFSGQLLDEDEGNIVLLSNMGLMQMYTFHGKNVWDEEHHRKISDLRAMPAEEMLANEGKIRKSIAYWELETPIKVMGREGEAFRVL